jgi:threonine/homoserine/homoserine lactone efflux protein
MPNIATLTLYLAAAIMLAITPGPGIFYVLTRSLKGGRREGYASSFGTAIGGLFHVVAAALGLSAILATSALAFFVVKYAGAAYLIYLGIRTLMSSDDMPDMETEGVSNSKRAFYQGILTEILNPKTALFFLAFIPQFVNMSALIVPQFIVLGCISVFLNTSMDLIVATLAGPIGYQLKKRVTLRKGQRIFTGLSLMGLGVYVALADSGKQQS